MGDEGPGEIPCPPAAKRLRRVAEVVMVLSAMAEIRGGRDPTPAEKAMAAEARESLTALCEGFKPKDLFPREAVRAMVEDLGLNKEAGMGFRPPRASIAERILQTKRKLEGPKEVPMNQYYPSQNVSVAFGASQMSVPGRGYHIQPVSASVQTRRSQMNEKSAGIAVSSPLGTLPHREALYLRRNGLAQLPQAGELEFKENCLYLLYPGPGCWGLAFQVQSRPFDPKQSHQIYQLMSSGMKFC